MNYPLVSIGLPVFNGELILKRVIEGVLNQSYRNFELIISDNCSDDKTHNICTSYEKNDSRIKYIRQEFNVGMLPNFNYVLKEAKGTYFMWIASDDQWTSCFLEQAVKILEKNPDCVSVISHYEIVDIENNNSIVSRVTPSSISSGITSLRIKRVLEELHPNMMYGLHRRIPFVDNQLYLIDWADVLFISRLVSYGKYFIIPEIHYKVGIKGTRRVPYSVTGKFLNLSPFLIKYATLLYNHSNGLLSFIKNIFFVLRIILISTIKVNRDIFRNK